MLLHYYYAQNYAGIIRQGLTCTAIPIYTLVHLYEMFSSTCTVCVNKDAYCLKLVDNQLVLTLRALVPLTYKANMDLSTR